MTTDELRACLKSVVDPEVGVNIVDMGLVYGVELDADRARVTMTMTSAACPMHHHLVRQAEQACVEALGPGVSVTVDVVFEPPWTPEMMSPEARRILGT